ncbi:MAG TPA: hypothetical protein PLV32_11120, partial [Chitinophagaceae bacterium]|nr:hypothetical protein [Chitinophagaceae bacterium]
MIRNSLLTALALLLLHALFVYVNPISGKQYALQGNTIKAQHFIYGDTDANIIIGSSLSNRLVMDSLQGMTNLSFSGQGIFDGLCILSHSGMVPRTVFVETNIMTRSENKNFTSYINSPILSPLKRAIPSLRDEHQPVGMLGESIIRGLKGENPDDETPDNMAAQRPKDDAFFKEILALQAESYNEPPDTTMLRSRFEDLANAVNALKQNGVRVIFFEMPVNETLCDLPEPRMIREYYRRYFPEDEYDYIRVP